VIPLPLLVKAYQTGFFPMAMRDRQIRWFSPDPRGIIPLDRFHVPKRLARVQRSGRFSVAIDRAFRDVICACGARPEEEGNWINDEIVETYCAMHKAGLAHSVEVWEGKALVGGLYGVSLGGAFFGESMFHRTSDASKVALVFLVTRLQARGYGLLDIQWVTPHLETFGATEIPRRQYLMVLNASLQLNCAFVD
jgi:leucyl/phenylalanyl-tRNA---protein transferase